VRDRTKVTIMDYYGLYALLSKERVKLRASTFGPYIHRVHLNKRPLKDRLILLRTLGEEAF